jgi:hypothetical protein
MQILSPPAAVLLRIGYVFLHLQTTEKVIKVAVQVVMPRDQNFLLSLLERLDETGRKKPLGHFLDLVRKRAKLNADVDSLLERFLANRNKFVHNLEEVEGWALESDSGRQAANEFLSQLFRDSFEVRTLFQGLLYSWKVQCELPTTPGEDTLLEKMSKYESPILRMKWAEPDA